MSSRVGGSNAAATDAVPDNTNPEEQHATVTCLALANRRCGKACSSGESDSSSWLVPHFLAWQRFLYKTQMNQRQYPSALQGQPKMICDHEYVPPQLTLQSPFVSTCKPLTLTKLLCLTISSGKCWEVYSQDAYACTQEGCAAHCSDVAAYSFTGCVNLLNAQLKWTKVH